jgi:hypothetical protein
MKENCVEGDHASTWLEDGIIYQVIKPHLKAFNLVIAKQLVEDRVKASNSTATRPVYLELCNMVSIDKETREYYAKEEPFKRISAIAVVVDNYVARLGGNLLYAFNKPVVPMVFFNDKSKALKWLEQYKLHKLN